jgi:hypothetical protein
LDLLFVLREKNLQTKFLLFAPTVFTFQVTRDVSG